MAPGTSAMLRARRKDVNVKPNRRLDRSSTRGMIYENEELRMRTINISAEVERGQDDIKKLRRENDALRRELWGLRDEYDKLEALLKRNDVYLEDSDGEKDDDETGGGSEGYSDQECGDESEEEDAAAGDQLSLNEDGSQAQSGRPDQSAVREVDFDLLSIVPEETDENQTDSQQSQDDAEPRSPTVPRRMYGYPVVDPLTGRPCGVVLPMDEASADTAAVAVAEMSAAEDLFLQPRGGPDVFVEGAYSMDPDQEEESVAGEAASQYLAEVVPPDDEDDVDDPDIISVLLTDVPKGATDAQVLAELAPFGALVGPIERPAGPSGDERIVRLRRPPQQRGLLPQEITVANTRVAVRIIDTTGSRDTQATRANKAFRSQLQVRLRAPAATLPNRRLPPVEATDPSSKALTRAASANVLQQRPQPSVQPGSFLPPGDPPVAVGPPVPPPVVLHPSVLPQKEWQGGLPLSRPQNPANPARRPSGPGRAMAMPLPVLPAAAPVTVPVTVPVSTASVSGVPLSTVPVPGVTVPVVPVPVPVTVHGGTVAVTAPSTTSNGTAGVNGVTVPTAANSAVPQTAGVSSSSQLAAQSSSATASAQSTSASNNAVNEAADRCQERLEVPESQTPGTASASVSPATARRNPKRNLLRKTSSDDSHSALPTPSPAQARRKPLRNCKGSSVTEPSAGSSSSTSCTAVTGPGAPPSPSTAIADHSQSSSSGQDSPHKSDRRRRVSIYLSRRPKNKSLGSQHLLQSGGSGDGGGDGSPFEQGATTSERERTASASSRDSAWSPRPRPRRNDRRDSADSGKVPWCGCWGNGCL